MTFDSEPTEERLTRLIQACSDEFTAIASRRGLERRQEQRKRAQWDWEKSHGKRSYKNTRLDYRPPTSSLQDPDDPKSYVADREQIHNMFLEAWKKVYRKHSDNISIWETFSREYGKYIPKAQFKDEDYVAEDFIQQLDRMNSTSAGFDGWTRDALRSLPKQAWEDRAKIENMAKKLGVLPDA